MTARLDVEAVRKRAEAATAGWQLGVAGHANIVSFDGCDIRPVGSIENVADRRFACAARTDVPALCDRVEALEAALAIAITFIADDTCRHDHEKAGVLLAARDALEGEP